MPHGRRRQRLAAALQGLLPGPEPRGLGDALALRGALDDLQQLHPGLGDAVPAVLVTVRFAGPLPPIEMLQRLRGEPAGLAGLQITTPPRWYRSAPDTLALLVGLAAEVAADRATCLRQLQALQDGLRRRGQVVAAAESLVEAAEGELRLVAQLLRPGDPGQLRLRLQAFGETLAARAPGGLHLLTDADRLALEEEDHLDRCLRCIGDEDIHLVFQPILLVNDPGRIALETLVRFRPPELARLGTQAVLQRAHDLDIAHRIDGLVLQRLGALQGAWRALGSLGERIDYVTLNICNPSVATLSRRQALVSTLRSQRFDPQRFRLELTETAATALLEADASLRSTAQWLIDELEIRLLIDDFGSGLSNYRRLCEASYDAIKLDHQLVRGIASSHRLQSFVGSLVEAVHGFGRSVIAEGVEHHRDLEALLRLGVDGLQGYLFARPQPWEALESFLRESPWTCPGCLPVLQRQIAEADRQLQDPLPQRSALAPSRQSLPLERYILEHWSGLRSFEEVVLLFVRELRAWGLEVLRFSLAFLPDQEEVDCSQYIWFSSHPGDVRSLRMQRDFLEAPQHLESALHHIATRCSPYRVRLVEAPPTGFDFVEELRQLGATDYLGLRLAARGVSVPVVTIALTGSRLFTDREVERIETMSGLLSLLFHAFECERASRLALLDSLTQLPNRRSFDSRIRAEVVAGATAQQPLALLLLDIDRFKAVNDSLGHAYGDACLRQVGDLLRRTLPRRSDMVARLGGEEFGVILAGTEAERAAAIAERLRGAVAEAAIDHPEPINGRGLTISIGVASWSPEQGAAADLDRLLQLADDCLYEAKRLGRDRVMAAALAEDRRQDEPVPAPPEL
ncbi:MAG: GGDEF domain-containing protein [Cyanobacteriota bacterium]|nr:GGDEF domain-containing protein [Cyanobacteriota bacterium]